MDNRLLSLGREPVRIDIFTHIPGLELLDLQLLDDDETGGRG